MEIRIPLPKGESVVIRLERRLQEVPKLPEGMYEYAMPPSRGIDRERIRWTFGSEKSDVYLRAYEDITGIRLRENRYYQR